MAHNVDNKKNTLLRRLLPGAPLILSLAISLGVSTNDGHAQSNQCLALRAELAKLPSGLGLSSFSNRKSPELKKTDKLVRRQQQAIRDARRDGRGLGCLTRAGDVIDGSGRQCRSLVRKIGKMEANLSKLRKKRDRLVTKSKATLTPRDIRAKRRAIQKQMRALNCSSPEETETASLSRSDRRPSFFERLFGRQRRKSRVAITRDFSEFDEPNLNGGVYRTLCVRLCDGYYFPVSFATVRSAFDTDQSICQASNPQTEMELFVHLNPSETSDDMVNIHGEPYINLPNAFRYRHELVNEDICPAINNRSNLSVIAGRDDPDIILDQPHLRSRITALKPQFTPAPAQRFEPFTDPDTRAVTVGKFQLKPVNQPKSDSLAAEVANIEYDPDTIADLGVRVVGPTFLADQGAAKLLLAPDHVEVQ